MLPVFFILYVVVGVHWPYMKEGMHVQHINLILHSDCSWIMK